MDILIKWYSFSLCFILHDLHILSAREVSSYLPVSIAKLCEEVRNLAKVILYFFSDITSKYFSSSKLCLKIQYACKREELCRLFVTVEVLSLQTVSQFLSVVAKHSQNRVVIISIIVGVFLKVSLYF